MLEMLTKTYSLNATWIRNNILRALKKGSEGSAARNLPQTVVYQHPSIRALSEFVFNVAADRNLETDHETVIARKIEAMDAMVAKFSVDFPKPHGGDGVPSKQETFLVTGTTGRLGSHLLAHLAQDPAVRHVYALNRGSSRDADQISGLVARQKAAFEQWELDAALLDSGKITILPANYAEDKLGLDAATYTEIERSVTTIIHNGAFSDRGRRLLISLTGVI
jgi:hypothetical protein